MKGRIAPVDGYDAPTQKRHVRRRVWNFFERESPTTCAARTALLLPSNEGTEIDVAIQHGFRVSNMVFVDKNPAIVAHLTRRYPDRLAAYGVSLGVAAVRAAEAGLLFDVLSLDHTGNLSPFGLLRDIAAVATVNIARPGALVFVNSFRGLEKKQAFADVVSAEIPSKARDWWLNECGIADELLPRVWAMIRAWGLGVSRYSRDVQGRFALESDTLIAPAGPGCGGTYKTAGGRSMCWCIFRVIPRSPRSAPAWSPFRPQFRHEGAAGR